MSKSFIEYVELSLILLVLSFSSCRMESKKVEMYININDGIKIWVETYGNPKHEACIFINGAGANSSFWSENLCTTLVNKGYFVIKYDHRDFGYSSKFSFEENPYTVNDLADDVIKILDHLEVNKVHAIGHSMGGFITQILAINYPDRLISFASISASTNSPIVPAPPAKTWEIFMQSSPQNNFEQDLDGFLNVWEYLNGTADFDKDLAKEYTKNLYARQEVSGALGESHVKAQANIEDRSEQLKQVNIPALIMHGEEDYLVDKYGGKQTAECLKNSKLVLVPKMGHLPFNKEILAQFENNIIEFIESH